MTHIHISRPLLLSKFAYRIFASLLCFSLGLNAQVDHSFGPDHTGAYPEIPGYQYGDPDSLFTPALEAYLAEHLQTFLESEQIYINGGATFLFKAVGESVTSVEVIDANSRFVEGMIIDALYRMPINTYQEGEVLVYHKVDQLLGCCRFGDMTEAQPMTPINRILAKEMAKRGYAQPDSLRWLLHVNDGRAQCLTLTPESDARFNDLLINYLFPELEQAAVPADNGAYLIAYDPTSIDSALLRDYYIDLITTDMESISNAKWVEALNRWLEMTGRPRFSSRFEVDGEYWSQGMKHSPESDPEGRSFVIRETESRRALARFQLFGEEIIRTPLEEWDLIPPPPPPPPGPKQDGMASRTPSRYAPFIMEKIDPPSTTD